MWPRVPLYCFSIGPLLVLYCSSISQQFYGRYAMRHCDTATETRASIDSLCLTALQRASRLPSAAKAGRAGPFLLGRRDKCLKVLGAYPRRHSTGAGEDRSEERRVGKECRA